MEARTLVRNARRRARLSQRALADAAGVPQSTVGRIEAGLVEPQAGTLSKLLETCGYELEAAPLVGEGVDRSQIRRLLRLSPRERLDAAANAAGNLRRLRRSARRKR